MTSRNWDMLNNREKLSVVTQDIKELLCELISLTAPQGELDTALDKSLESFEPLLQAFNIQLEEEPDNQENGWETTLTTMLANILKRRLEDPSKRSVSKLKRNKDNNESQTKFTESPENTEDTESVPNVSDRVLRKDRVPERFDEPGPSGEGRKKRRTPEMTVSSEVFNNPEVLRRSASEKLDQPVPIRERLRKRRTQSARTENNESVYETLTHIPIPSKENDSSYRSKGDKPSSIY